MAGDIDQLLSGAVASMADKAFLATVRYQNQQWRATRTGAHVKILDFERAFIKRAKKLGVPLFAHNMVRTPDEQKRLFVQGHSKISGSAGPGPHMVGCAVDIVHGTRAWDLGRNEWAILGHIGKEEARRIGVKIRWGGDWSFYDPAHWELENWRDIAKEQT